MRFKGTPGMYVMDSTTGMKIGRFDEKGYMDISDEKLAKRMKNKFAFEQVKQKKAEAPKSEEVK